MKKHLPKKLQETVSWSVRLLGEAIKLEYGTKVYKEIDLIRQDMKEFRPRRFQTFDGSYKLLTKELKKLKKYTNKDLKAICHSFACMLELINRCEVAYRNYRLQRKSYPDQKNLPYAIIYVLTAHPTEARSPECLNLFGQIQYLLFEAMEKDLKNYETELRHLLKLTLKTPLARSLKPTVKDEADHIFSFALKEEIIDQIVKFKRKNLTFTLRSWVGGDKDGHPGVDEKTLNESLELSRKPLIEYIRRKLFHTFQNLDLIEHKATQSLNKQVQTLTMSLGPLRKIRPGDGEHILKFRKRIDKLAKDYEKFVGIKSPGLESIQSLNWVFPALVLPLEVREDSELVAQALSHPQKFAIGKMLISLKRLSKGFDPKWYVRGFVLSMAEQASDIRNGIKLVKKTIGVNSFPVVPLFENEKALANAKKILEETFKQEKTLIPRHKKLWGSRYEVMLGYSDSSKENGVFASRLLIHKAMQTMDKVLRKHKLTPVFFHGSGGSVARGGGSIEEQTQWWPKSAINIYKATIQGEMVARTFASAAILESGVERIADQIDNPRTVNLNKEERNIINQFSATIQKNYRESVGNDEFLKIVEAATPYSFLDQLKIGSRPTKRAGKLAVGGLRAIPWILCWTQTRILFPTWWGVGSAWETLNEFEQNSLKKSYKKSNFLRSYFKILGFTLAKVELIIWKIYLDESKLSQKEKHESFKLFQNEFNKTKKCLKEVTGENNFLWYRPWLDESIILRSSMIHPLNLIQIIALKRGDMQLLRETVTGIASGMLTTG